MTALTLLASLPLPILLLIVGCTFTLLLITFLIIALVPTAGKRITSFLSELRHTRDYLRLPLHSQFQKSIPSGTEMLHIDLFIESNDRAELITFIGSGGFGKANLLHSEISAALALDQVTQDHLKLFLSIASGIVHDYDTAQDIVQDALEKTYKALQLYPEERLEKMHWKSWICKIVVHTALNHQKSKSRVRYLTLSSDWFAEKQGPLFEQPEFQLLRNEVMSTLITALDTLPKAQKDVVSLRFFEDYSLKEIAHELRCPIGTVKSHLHRALASLRIVLEKEGTRIGDIAAFVKAESGLLADIIVLKDKDALTLEYEYVL